MAKDGTVQAPKMPDAVSSEADRYFDKLYDDYSAGRIDFGQMYDLYTQKYGEPDFSKPHSDFGPEIPRK